MTYLTYIIEHYHQPIPEVVVFVHSHRNGFFRAWHVDTALHSNVDSIRHLRLDHVLKTGYVNLRCNPNPGCMRLEKRNSHVTGHVWKEIFANTSTPVFNPHSDGPAAVSSSYEPQYRYSSLNGADTIQSESFEIKSPCCAQFAVSAKQIYQRPLNDYVNIRQWLLDTDLDNAHSGRVMEYLWHVIFGKEAVQYVPTLKFAVVTLAERKGLTLVAARILRLAIVMFMDGAEHDFWGPSGRAPRIIFFSRSEETNRLHFIDRSIELRTEKMNSTSSISSVVRPPSASPSDEWARLYSAEARRRTRPGGPIGRWTRPTTGLNCTATFWQQIIQVTPSNVHLPPPPQTSR